MLGSMLGSPFLETTIFRWASPGFLVALYERSCAATPQMKPLMPAAKASNTYRCNLPKLDA